MDLPPSSFRATYNRFVLNALDTAELKLARHWLALANGALALFLGLPVLAPFLLAWGLPVLADPIYFAYRAICHQWAFRSFFVLGEQPVYSRDQLTEIAGVDRVWDFIGAPGTGYKMAFCERDLAIFLAALLMGLLYIRYRRRLAPPSLRFYALLLVPIAVDGFTQLPGWRESTWEFRVSTGAIAGIATVWLVYPYLELRADRYLSGLRAWQRQVRPGLGTS